MPSADPLDSRAAKLALSFADALVKREIGAARNVFAPSLRDDLSQSELTTPYEQMISYWKAPPDATRLLGVDGEGADWPGKTGHDIAWVCVAIDNLACSYLEGVTVRVVKEAGHLLIGQIVWGRP